PPWRDCTLYAPRPTACTRGSSDSARRRRRSISSSSVVRHPWPIAGRRGFFRLLRVLPTAIVPIPEHPIHPRDYGGIERSLNTVGIRARTIKTSLNAHPTPATLP